MAEKETGTLAVIGQIIGAFKAVWGGIVMVIAFPKMVAAWLTSTLQQIIPDFLNWPINDTIALILAIACALLWAKRYGVLTSWMGKLVGWLPLLGGFLSLAIQILMWWSLYQGCRAITSSGWLPALIFLTLTLAINAPALLKKIGAFGIGAGALGKDAVIKGSKSISRAGKKVAAIQLKDPLSRVIWESMEQLQLECTKGGLVDDELFLARAKHIQELLIDEYPDKASLIESRIKAFAAEMGIRVIDARPITEATLKSLEFASK